MCEERARRCEKVRVRRRGTCAIARFAAKSSRRHLSCNGSDAPRQASPSSWDWKLLFCAYSISLFFPATPLKIPMHQLFRTVWDWPIRAIFGGCPENDRPKNRVLIKAKCRDYHLGAGRPFQTVYFAPIGSLRALRQTLFTSVLTVYTHFYKRNGFRSKLGDVWLSWGAGGGHSKARVKKWSSLLFTETTSYPRWLNDIFRKKLTGPKKRRT